MEKIFFFSGLFNALISTVFGLFVYLKNSENKVNKTFALFCLSVAVWSYAYMFWPISSSKSSVLFWFQMLHIGASFTSIAYLHFVVSWLNLYEKNKIIISLGYILAFFFSFFVFSPLFIADIIPKFDMKFWAEPGIIYHFYLIYFFSFFLYSSVLLLISFKKSLGIKRVQIKYILVGMVIAFLGGSTNYPLWYDINLPPYGNVLVSFYVILSAYAIIRYRLMDIKLVLRQSSVYIISLIVIFFFASVIKIVITKYFGEFVFWMDLMIIFFAVATFPYLKNKFFKLANEYFFTSLYDSQKLILQTGNELKTVLNIERVYDFLFSVFIKNFHIKAFGVLTYNESEKNYILRYNQNFKAKKGDIFASNLVVENTFIAQNQIVITEELKNLYYSDETKDLINLLENLGVELLIPLKIKGAPIGLLAMGGKETDEAYNEEDLKVLEIIAGQAAVAIENAQLYSEVQKFNIRLKKEIRKATENLNTTNYELISSNKKLSNAYKSLKQLDSAKNEFISIASHQLRTPLTSIKGFISLIREGDYGKISKQVDGALKKIFISNERLIKLVNDILNLSRIESGTFTFNFGKNDLTAMIKNVVEDFSLEIEDRGLKIKFNKPEKKIPLFVFDRDKMQEVISNLIDNAIKYTTAGKIEVDIKDFERKIRIIISDTGKGMEADEAKYVFEKFRRGVGSSSLNTEGTGLGLYVCKKIVNAHDGNIFAKSDGPEKGSQFIVELRKDLKMGKEK